MKKNSKRLILVLIVAALIILFWLFWAFDLSRFLTLESLKTHQAELEGIYTSHPELLLSGYFLIYVLTTSLSIPGATILTLLGGALFGFWVGLIVISFASTLGATCSFLVARTLLQESVQKKLGDRLEKFNRGIEEEGAFYLFALRLLPIFPFFVINLVMGLTPLRTWTFYWVSQLGMLPGTLAYVNAGTQLAQIDSLRGIVSPSLLFSFTILGVLPILAKTVIIWIRAHRKRYTA